MYSYNIHNKIVGSKQDIQHKEETHGITNTEREWGNNPNYERQDA